MTNLARRERTALADLLARLGPEAPTLCEGWDTGDLAAHLVVRERRPDSALGIVLPAFADRAEAIRRRYRARPFEELVGMLRRPPWWSPVSNPVVEPFADTVEFFVHHEDVRRAAPGWRPRELPRAAAKDLWGRLGVARLLLRRTGLTVTLAAPGFGRRTFGRNGVDAVVTGEPGELLLFCFGRGERSRVELSGPAAERLRSARLGL
ncbi:uncharacterized protein (TIGR03085 family) [Stackebrandtia albiflava]|uniref:Uncharacterized protein (TIGR03085 family) n=1 Tax=Stackebrandtia albiflava TaxID=406432 RepID=A0A562VBQ6_9ACTN|nr:TIGR03085 family metal-binding protein [Stackebrandtia albiflava]TWJ15313.1 uncharacterized protein (TIGR03085 family) [Stackebrandtia albiflava]